MAEDRCVCCGEIIPEGRMVCPNCEVGSMGKQTMAKCNDCLHQCYTEATEESCNFFIDKTKYMEVVHGRWILTAHEEYANCRWNVTAECSECHHEKGEIYAGFFTGFPKDLARDVVLDSARSVKLDNYCPNCGAKMDGERKDNG